MGSDLARFEQALASAGLLNNDEGSDAGRRVVQALEELDDPRALMGMATYHIVFTVSGWTSPFSFCTLALSGEQRARFFLRPATEEPVDSARAEGDISFDPADTPWGRLVAGLDQPYVTFSLGGECPRWTITGTLLP
ncbi:MAG TPA: hypothetical protein VLM76_02020 [Patescibacteria group bacterium]|nr:hypothetical protein [Patescibacteria group bacterium]